MALHPNALEKWFNTSDYRLKNSFIKAGLPTTVARPGMKGKPSKAFILVK